MPALAEAPKTRGGKLICPQITQIPTDSFIKSSGHLNHSPFTVHRSPFTIHHSPFTVHSSPFTVHCSLFPVSCSLFTIHHSPFTLHCSLFPVSCSLFTFHRHRSLLPVHRSPFTVHRQEPPPQFYIMHSTFYINISPQTGQWHSYAHLATLDQVQYLKSLNPLKRVNGILMEADSPRSNIEVNVSIPSNGSMAFLWLE